MAGDDMTGNELREEIDRLWGVIVAQGTFLMSMVLLGFWYVETHHG